MRTLAAHARTTFYGASILSIALATGFLVITEGIYGPRIAADVVLPSVAPEASFSLTIEKLAIDVPIIENVSGTNEAEYLAAIEHGVAQMAGSQLPGEPGNLFLFGHSDYYYYKPGDYKEVFKTLDQLGAGDRFTVWREATAYEYEVVTSKQVSADDWSITNPTPDDSSDTTATIMTCWPPGTTDYRWVVVGKATEPELTATTRDYE